jgi:hypothetical protein
VKRFNPEFKLKGAMHSIMAGTNLFVVGTNGLFVVGLSNDTLEAPTLIGELTTGLKSPRAIAVQFRYAFVTDDEGLKVIDITQPRRPKLLPGATVPLNHAGRLYVARAYAYVPNGPEGLAIIDIENPEKPRLEQMYNADGALDDTRAVQVGSISASMFALVADGKNGLRVLQLVSPENVPNHAGFSPTPNPKLIATYKTKSPALAVSRGLDRDRVVDETGNQTVVFGRRGARPFTLEEMQRFYWRSNALYMVEDVNGRYDNVTNISGTVLKPTFQFKQYEHPPAVAAQPGERIMRRGH